MRPLLEDKNVNVVELIEELRKYDPDLPVLLPRSDCSALEDAVACYPDVVREGQIMGYESLSWFPWEPDDPATEKLQVIVIDFSQQFPMAAK
ncbi:hypothetical protein C1882_01880 [Pseudomonas sp. FW305-E2]|jgi:hypothetical protein|nr:hypothetical protein C1882_01880 [Pseudomonas sp. FW305-E2]PYB93694.1 hypothetical protein DMX01_04005 [Pseudomonas fulva]PYC16520.1 hypothetical protein DMX00_05600 [Pseudomonas fulva]